MAAAAGTIRRWSRRSRPWPTSRSANPPDRVSREAAAMNFDPRALLRRMFDAAIEAAQPSHCVPPHLPDAPKGRFIVLGAGKASAAMARVIEDHWHGEISGLVVTRYGYGVPCDKIEIVEAAHPVPDAAGLAAARRIRDRAASAGPDDTVLCLISGGGSSLLGAARSGSHARRQAGGQPRLVEIGSDHFGDELRASSPVRRSRAGASRRWPIRPRS